MTAETTAPPQVPAAAQAWSFGMPTPNLNKALSLLHGEMPKIMKNKTGEIEGQNKRGEWYKYTYYYADLADIAEAVDPLMAKYGLAFTARPTRDPANRNEMILIWSLLHESGEERSGEYPLGLTNQRPQALGSMLTYARRYCKTTSLDIVAEEDDDGKRAQALSRTGRESAGDDRPNSASRQRGRSDGPPRDQVAEALAKLAVQIAADENKTVGDLDEQVGKRAAGKGKLDSLVDDPFGEGRLRLRDVLREARHRMGAVPKEGQGDQPGSPDEADGDAAAAERQWIYSFIERVSVAEEEQLGELQKEIGPAVRERVISPQASATASAEVQRRRRQLREGYGRDDIAAQVSE